MKKCILAVLVFLLLVLASCTNKTTPVGESKTYEIASEIHSLNIQINAADFIIEHGDRFAVESNLKHLSVSEHDGVLSIVEGQKYGIHGVDYTNAVLKLCIPDDMVFKTAEITSGAAKLTADSLSADFVELKLGAGNVQFECLNAYSNADIEGGVGKIVIASGTLHNLVLEMGVGELNLSAALLGSCDLEFGVGASNLTLIGSKDDYTMDIEKGIGSISVDGTDAFHFSSGNGPNTIEIEGGVGAVDIAFNTK